MQYELSATFARIDSSARTFQEIWRKLCHDLLAAAFPSSSIVLMMPHETGIDLLDQTTGTAYCCHAVDEPSRDSLSVEVVVAALELAVRHRGNLGWNRYNILTNIDLSVEGISFIEDRLRALQVESEKIGFLGPAIWNRLCSDYPRIVGSWFDYRIQVSKEAVKKAFEGARYYPENVAKYAAQIAEADYNVVLTNNRTALELVIPFASQLTFEHLLDVGKELLDLSLEATDFRDLGTSARLSLSVLINEVAQGLSTPLGGVPVPSGGEAQIWIKIIWGEKSFDQTWPDDTLPRSGMQLRAHLCYRAAMADLSPRSLEGFILGLTPSTPSKTESPGEETMGRKAAVISAHIWQKAKELFTAKLAASQAPASGSAPVRLGASAPRAVCPGSSFAARFIAYHPELEAELTTQLDELDPAVKHRLDCVRAVWKLGTRVTVRVYGEDLIADPESDEFFWGGEKHILDFRVRVGKNAMGPRDLKFDIFIEDHRINRIWMPLEVSANPTGKLQGRTVSSPRTAFASYASEDRLRVLDRVATLEIHCGLQVFLDCVSMRPNAKWRQLLPDMVMESDQLLLFWSKAARDSTWVDKEWRIAFGHKGVDGIEIHPLSTYEEARLPRELADLAHGADPMMTIRNHEERVRSAPNT